MRQNVLCQIPGPKPEKSAITPFSEKDIKTPLEPPSKLGAGQACRHHGEPRGGYGAAGRLSDTRPTTSTSTLRTRNEIKCRIFIPQPKRSILSGGPQPVVEACPERSRRCGAAPTRPHPSTTHGAECESCKAVDLVRRAPLRMLTLGHELRCYTYSVTVPEAGCTATGRTIRCWRTTSNPVQAHTIATAAHPRLTPSLPAPQSMWPTWTAPPSGSSARRDASPSPGQTLLGPPGAEAARHRRQEPGLAPVGVHDPDTPGAAPI